jgi:hypothetical protein
MTEEEIIIENIIRFLNEQPLADIKYIMKDRPMAAFILAACFIDQLGAYRYNISKNRKRWAAIIDEYMYPGKGKDLFTTLRSDLVHNYSLKQFRADLKTVTAINFDNNAISFAGFVNDIIVAVDKVCMEFRTEGSEARKNAIAWNKKYPAPEHIK